MAMNTIVKRHFTWSEWIDKASNLGPDGFCGHEENVGWAGASKKDALRMATKDGYSEAVPDAEALAEGLYDTVRAHVMADGFQAAYDTCGSEVDIARFMSGTPECMIESAPIKVARNGRAVRICVNCSYNAVVNENTVRRRGAAVMALVYVLQQLQHPLEVWVTDTIEVMGNRGAWSVEVQRADEPADIGRVMFAVAHPAMLRQLAFSVEDHEPARIRSQLHIGAGYGRAGEIEVDDLPDQGGTTIILPQLQNYEEWSIPESIAWIQEQLKLIFS